MPKKIVPALGIIFTCAVILNLLEKYICKHSEECHIIINIIVAILILMMLFVAFYHFYKKKNENTHGIENKHTENELSSNLESCSDMIKNKYFMHSDDLKPFIALEKLKCKNEIPSSEYRKKRDELINKYVNKFDKRLQLKRLFAEGVISEKEFLLKMNLLMKDYLEGSQ